MIRIQCPPRRAQSRVFLYIRFVKNYVLVRENRVHSKQTMQYTRRVILTGFECDILRHYSKTPLLNIIVSSGFIARVKAIIPIIIVLADASSFPPALIQSRKTNKSLYICIFFPYSFVRLSTGSRNSNVGFV